MSTNPRYPWLLEGRKPYPDRPWQRWLGLSAGGPRWRMTQGGGVWGAAMGLAPSAFLLLTGFVSLAGGLTHPDVGVSFFLGVGGPLLACIGYALMVSFSAGHLQKDQLEKFEEMVGSDPRLGEACVRWMNEDDILRTRDLWRMRLAVFALKHQAKPVSSGQDPHEIFWQKVAIHAGPVAPFPASMTPTEQAQAHKVLVKLCTPTPVRANIFHFGLGQVMRVMGPLFPWDLMGGGKGRALLVVISLSIQAVIGWKIVPRFLPGMNHETTLVSAIIGTLLVNAIWFYLPRLRLRAPGSLYSRIEKSMNATPLVAWVLSRRCPDTARASSKDLVAMFAVEKLMRRHDAACRDKLMASAYRDQIDRLPVIGASRSQVMADALNAQTPDCPEQDGIRRRL